MRKRIYKVFVLVLALSLIMSSYLPVYAYLTEHGQQATMIRLTRTISSTTSLVGREDTITYSLTGDTVVYDPPKDIALVVDVSGSMDWMIDGSSTNNNSLRRITMLKNSVTDFVSKWQGRNAKICIVPFSTIVDRAPVLISMKDTDCLTKLGNVITGLSAYGYTNIGDGMRVAYYTLKNSPSTNASKYIVTMTDGDPNKYTCQALTDNTTKNTYYTGSGVVLSNRSIENITKGLGYATTSIGNMIVTDGSFKSFVIGFATPSSLITKLNSVGQYSGATKRSNGNYFYSANSQTELDTAYSDISQIISNDVPFTGANFSDILPQDVEIPSDMVTELMNKGFVVTTNYDYLDNGVHKLGTLISKSFSNELKLTRKYPDPTTPYKARIYQLSPLTYIIRIKYTVPGEKIYFKDNAKVTYYDPFNPNTSMITAKPDNDIVVSVTQPVTDFTVNSTVVMIGQNDGLGTLVADVSPNNRTNVAENRKIRSWTIINAFDVNNNPVGLGTVVSFSDPSPTDLLSLLPVNSVKKITPLTPGAVTVEVETDGTDLTGNTMKKNSYVKVVDAWLNATTTVPLNGSAWLTRYTSIPSSATGNIYFNNWRLNNPSDSSKVLLTSQPDPLVSGSFQAFVTGVTSTNPTDPPVTISVDVTYEEPPIGGVSFVLTKTISCNVNVLPEVPVDGVTLNNQMIMTGVPITITAIVTPPNATYTDIDNWSLVSATDVNGSPRDINGNPINPSSIISMVNVPTDPNKQQITGLKAGTVIIQAETRGLNAAGETIKKQITITVLDPQCTGTASVMLWKKTTLIPPINPTAGIPAGTSGTMVFNYTSVDPAIANVFFDIVTHQWIVSGNKLGTTTISVTATYNDAGGNPVPSLSKTFTINAQVVNPDIDIN